MGSAGKPGIRVWPLWLRADCRKAVPPWHARFVARRAGTEASGFAGFVGLGVGLLLLLSSRSVLGQAELARPERSPPAPSLITNLLQLRQLTRDQARQGPPVNLSATVTSFDSQWGALFVADAEGACYISVTNQDVHYQAGQVLAVRGRAKPGLTPQIAFEHLAVLSNAPLPAARLVSMDDLINNRNDCHRVEVHTVIRSMYAQYERLILDFGESGGRFEAHLPNYTAGILPTNLLDARVDITGVVGANFNRQGQLVGIRLYLVSLDDVRVREAAPADSFAIPAITIKTVSLASPAQAARVKILGTVTLSAPSGRLYVQDESGGILARLFPRQPRLDEHGLYLPAPDASEFHPGDQVEVAGYPALGEYAPQLADALVRRTGTGVLPSAAMVTSAEALTGGHDACLVRLRARLLARAPRRWSGIDYDVLTMQDGSTLFEAALLAGENAATFKLGSMLRLTGVCEVQADEFGAPRAFRLNVPTAGGIELLQSPPRFGLVHAVGGVSLLAALALVWIWQLRRQVERQQRKVVERERAEREIRELNASLESRVAARTSELAEANTQLRRVQADLVKALDQERELTELKSNFVSMVSHEFRTPLGITMSAVELLRSYLDRLPAEKLKELLDDIYTSTLCMSALMEQVLLLGRVEAGKLGFKTALLDVAALAGRLTDEAVAATHHKCLVTFQATNDLGDAYGDEALVRHIFSNLLSNAVKYSETGSNVELSVRREGDDAVFTVRDRGIGIPEADQARLFEAFHRAANASRIPGTGLGLLIVKRCVELHNGAITFESCVGAGTTFTVRLPLFRVP